MSKMEWQPIETAPKDRPVLVFYDHKADTYCDPSDRNKLTAYAAHAESGDFMDGSGICVAKWAYGWFESEDIYGNGYHVPGFWFPWIDHDFDDRVCNPIYWMSLPDAPNG